VKVLSYSLIAAAFVLGAQAAHSATLGTVEYQAFVHTSTDFRADLGGAVPTLPDATIIWNDYDGAATLPGGLPANYDIHVPATFRGDFNVTTADAFDDRFVFTLDPSTLGGQTSAGVDATLNLVFGVNTGFDNATFGIYESTGDGVLGAALATRTGGGQLMVGGLDAGADYLLRVTGNLRTDDAGLAGDQSTNVGQYKIVLGLAPVPVPPALLLLTTAVGALFGVGKLRRRILPA
jgi:hypothetical protein